MWLRCSQILKDKKEYFTYYFVGMGDDPVGIQLISVKENKYRKGLWYYFSIIAKEQEMPKKEEQVYAELGS